MSAEADIAVEAKKIKQADDKEKKVAEADAPAAKDAAEGAATKAAEVKAAEEAEEAKLAELKK